MRVFLVLLFFLVLSQNVSADFFKIWKCSTGKFENSSFIHINDNEWICREKNLTYQVYYWENETTIILKDIKNDFLIKLTESEISFKNNISEWRVIGEGEWISNLPSRLIVNKYNLKYGEELDVNISNDLKLAPNDKLVIKYQSENSQPKYFYALPIRIKPEKNCQIILSTTKFDFNQSITANINVDTNTYFPKSINYEPKSVCKGDLIKVTLPDGQLGINASWQITSNNDKLYKPIVTDKNEIVIQMSESVEFTLRAIVNNKPLENSLSFKVDVKEHSVTPLSILAEDIICKDKEVTLRIEGGSLGTGGRWIWIVDNVKHTTYSSYLFTKISSSTNVSVSAKGDCNQTNTVTRKILLYEDYLGLKYSKIYHLKGKGKKFTLYTIFPDSNNITYNWQKSGSRKVLSTSYKLENVKINENTEIRLLVTTPCGSQTLTFKDSNLLDLKSSSIQNTKPFPHSNKTSSHKDLKKQKEFNRIQAELSTGIGNRVGFAGINLNLNMNRILAVSAGVGLSTWGLKYNTEIKLFLRKPYQGGAIAFGWTHNSGIRDWETNMETTMSINEVVKLTLLPIDNIYGAIYWYKKGNDKFHPYFSVSYSYKLNDIFYFQTSGNPITQNSIETLNFIRPGGIGIAYGVAF
jgi:hypothetical protein